MYSWGQLRLLVRQDFPGVHLDRIDEVLNTTYANILDHIPWFDLEGRTYVNAAAAYSSLVDTVAVVKGSANIVGTGTAWTAPMSGMLFFACQDGPSYTFTFADATHGVLDRPYEGSSQAATSYYLVTKSYPMPADAKAIRAVESGTYGRDLPLLSQTELGESVGFRDSIGVPEGYYLSTSDDGTPSIEFWPRPCLSQGYPVRYERNADPCNDDNVGLYPFSFVRDNALLAGARAALHASAGNMTQMEAFAVIYKTELAGMVMVDSKKRPKEALKPADWMVAHRRRRLMR